MYKKVDECLFQERVHETSSLSKKAKKEERKIKVKIKIVLKIKRKGRKGGNN